MPDDLVRHLRYYAELGVAGISRDPAWRTRQESARAECFGRRCERARAHERR